ncbi:MAG: hypothetical protein AAF211_10630 [Myxococcota bacterium]
MIGLLAWLGCVATPVPDGLVQALSGYHEVPSVEALTERFPDLGTHLPRLALDPDTAPHVRTRAWVLLAAMPEGADRARAAVVDPELPPVMRYKVLRQLAETDRAAAGQVLPQVWCAGSSVLRSGARRVASTLAAAGRPVPRTACD